MIEPPRQSHATLTWKFTNIFHLLINEQHFRCCKATESKTIFNCGLSDDDLDGRSQVNHQFKGQKLPMYTKLVAKRSVSLRHVMMTILGRLRKLYA